MEMIAVVAILGVLLSSAIPTCIDRINRAKYERMINEMTSIAQASIDFYDSQYPNIWPTNLGQLVPKYMEHTVPLNPWGNPYLPSFPNNGKGNLVEVSTIIPSGIAESNPQGAMVMVSGQAGTSDDQISIAQSVPNEEIGMVQYEKKFTYNQ